MSTGEQAQAAPAAAAAEAQEVSLLDKVLTATKQTERSRAEDLEGVLEKILQNTEELKKLSGELGAKKEEGK